MNKSLSGNEIKEIRSTLKMKAKVFAALLGISAPYLSEIENGKKEPSQQLVNLILSKAAIPADHSNQVTLRDLYDLQKQMQELTKSFGEEIGALKMELQKATKDFGKEIGELKTDTKKDLLDIHGRMLDAAQTGDIKLLGLVGGKGR